MIKFGNDEQFLGTGITKKYGFCAGCNRCS